MGGRRRLEEDVGSEPGGGPNATCWKWAMEWAAMERLCMRPLVAAAYKKSG